MVDRNLIDVGWCPPENVGVLSAIASLRPQKKNGGRQTRTDFIYMCSKSSNFSVQNCLSHVLPGPIAPLRRRWSSWHPPWPPPPPPPPSRCRPGRRRGRLPRAASSSPPRPPAPAPSASAPPAAGRPAPRLGPPR